MSTRLVILGLLREQPLHGYELKQIIVERMGDWTDVAFGSIYFALGKLNDEGFVEQIATEKEGGRPSRYIYQITESGRQEFLRLVRETWSGIKPFHFELDLGLYFANAISKDEIIAGMDKRLKWLEDVIHHLESHRAESLENKPIPAEQKIFVEAIFDHALYAYRAEWEWLKDLHAKYLE